MAKLEEKTHDGKPRCQARMKHMDWMNINRQQCFHAAKPGELFCGTHLAKAKRDMEAIRARKGTKT